MVMAPFIEFHLVAPELLSKRRITKMWDVTTRGAVGLGQIEWWSHWRRYVFSPLDVGLIFDASCLEAIAAFIEVQMVQWRDEQHHKAMSRGMEAVHG